MLTILKKHAFCSINLDLFSILSLDLKCSGNICTFLAVSNLQQTLLLRRQLDEFII
jgi:hypothetical protein